MSENIEFIEYGGNGNYKVAILIKHTVMTPEKIRKFYIDDLVELGIPEKDILVVALPYDTKDKVSNATIKNNIPKLFANLRKMGIKYVMVADSKYFVPMAGLKKVGNTHGYRFNCALPGCEDMTLTLGVNYGSVIYNPSVSKKLKICNKALADIYLGIYREPGQTAIKSAKQLKTLNEIQEYLYSLHKYPRISCDIEAFSLKFWEAGIGTIAFATSPTEGAGFHVDYICFVDAKGNSYKSAITGCYGSRDCNNDYSRSVRELLRDFFLVYRGKIYYHGINYDAKVLAFELFMAEYKHSYFPPKLQDKATKTMLRGAHCTKVLAYLATNNCAENSLALKDQAQDIYGDWAEDVKNILTVPLDKLIHYNIVDACATLHMADKYESIVKEEQWQIYQEMYVPFYDIGINTELNGMPMRYSIIEENNKKLKSRRDAMAEKLLTYSDVAEVTHSLKLLKKVADDAKLKTKERTLEELEHIKFNPGSSDNVIRLVYHHWGEPVLKTTDKGSPSTKAKILEGILAKYVSENKLSQEHDYCLSNGQVVETYTYRAQMLHLIIQITRADKIISTFFKAFLEGRKIDDSDIIFLHGNLNSTGTKSGRLSSSDPNLQNIPSNAALAKLVKECFVAPPTKIFGGADFSSLEDRISALTTKDPNKLKVYTDGYDGHCLRAFSYFGEQMPDIEDDTDVELINSIQKKYPALRQDSKAPTFLLTYQGTYLGLMENCGFSEKKAKIVEQRYHDMYHVSDEWVKQQLIQAAKDGYVTLAFGLKLRTPLLSEYNFRGSKSGLPKAAQKEMRTAGNALGQSYCLLNNRAAIEFVYRLRKSPYAHRVWLCCMIHDAIYLYWDDDIEVTQWVNKNLGECMAWQKLPEIQHPEVKLSGELDIFYPDWGSAITLPNNASPHEIKSIVKKALIGKS